MNTPPSFKGLHIGTIKGSGFINQGSGLISPTPSLWLAGNAGMEKRKLLTTTGYIGLGFRAFGLEGMAKNMKTTIGTTIRTISFIPS